MFQSHSNICLVLQYIVIKIGRESGIWKVDLGDLMKLSFVDLQYFENLVNRAVEEL